MKNRHKPLFRRSIDIVNRDLDVHTEIVQSGGPVNQDDLEHTIHTKRQIVRLGLHACIPSDVSFNNETLSKLLFHPALAGQTPEAISEQAAANTGVPSHFSKSRR